jgi:hypothetical protein
MKTPLLLIAMLLCLPAHGAGKLRDPTRPLAATVRATTSPVADPRPVAPVAVPELQLVLVGGERRYAVIDGELLAEGDAIRGLTLLQVMNDAVVLKTPNGPRTLPLSSPSEP